LDGTALLQRQERILGGLLRLIQRLLRAAPGPRWRGLWLVTRGAQHVDTDETVHDIEAAPLWALTRSANGEHPGLSARAVDLDPQNPQVFDCLVAELTSNSVAAPEQIAFRGGKRFVMRLRPLEARGGAIK